MCHASTPASLLPAAPLFGGPHWLVAADTRFTPRVGAAAGGRLGLRAFGLALGSVALAMVIWLVLAGPGFVAHGADAPRPVRTAAR